MVTVDFVYDENCPNVKAARANLIRAFARIGLPARWTEHQIGAPEAPLRVRGFGSPTVLVDGEDVGGLAAGAEECCRLYPGGGAPGVELIAEALSQAERASSLRRRPPTPPRGRWRSTAAILPGIGIALMPKVICPLCWPLYAGVLSAAGLTFLMEDRWLLPLSGVFLGLALAALAWRARSRRGYGPLALGALSCTVILAGKFLMQSDATVYVGVAVLVVACSWNAWPQRTVEPSCSACRSIAAD